MGSFGCISFAGVALGDADMGTAVAKISVTSIRKRLTQELRLAEELLRRYEQRERAAKEEFRLADEVDRIISIEASEMELFGRERLSSKILFIRQTLDRIAKGEYGVCVVCEKEISSKRLRALPTVTKCLECQAKSEPSQKRGVPRVFEKIVSHVSDSETADYLRGYARGD